MSMINRLIETCLQTSDCHFIFTQIKQEYTWVNHYDFSLPVFMVIFITHKDLEYKSDFYSRQYSEYKFTKSYTEIDTLAQV